MALSQYTTTGNGSSNTFSINFTLGIYNRESVTCWVEGEVDGLGDPIYRTLTWINDGMVTVDGAIIGSGVPVRFIRTMNKSELANDYANGDPIIEENLDKSNKQLMMAVHEVIDGRIGPIEQNIDMGGYKLTNAGEPTDDGDVVTKAYGDEHYGGGAVIEAEAARDAAIAARNDAQSAQAAAEVAQAAAEQAELDAQAAQQAAEDAEDGAEGALQAAVDLLDDVLHLDGSTPMTADLPVGPHSLLLDEISSPTAPDANKVKVYAKSDGKVYRQDDSGTEKVVGEGGGFFRGNNGATGDAVTGPNDIFRVNSQTLSTNTTIGSTENASATGPIVIDTGVTLQVDGNLVIT